MKARNIFLIDFIGAFKVVHFLPFGHKSVFTRVLFHQTKIQKNHSISVDLSSSGRKMGA